MVKQVCDVRGPPWMVGWRTSSNNAVLTSPHGGLKSVRDVKFAVQVGGVIADGSVSGVESRCSFLLFDAPWARSLGTSVSLR